MKTLNLKSVGELVITDGLCRELYEETRRALGEDRAHKLATDILATADDDEAVSDLLSKLNGIGVD
jgi:hypothetical protein